MMGTIRMELLSDALPGSGEGLAGIIDLDITHDEHGLPYIPARRLKGLLLESARHLQDAGIIANDISALFGYPGQGVGASLHVGNGCVDGEDQYRDLLDWAAEDSAAKTLLSPAAVLDYFTYLRSRTAIDEETGTARDDTLRTVRVLRRMPPETETPLAFVFRVDCPAVWERDLAVVCKVTRSFGVSRSRGLGSIRLTYDKVANNTTEGHQSNEAVPSDGRVTISLMARNTNPLVITNRAGTHQSSANFIPGATILGVLASRYIARQVSRFVPDADEVFRHLFLDGQVTFSDLTAMDVRGSRRSMPAPKSVQQEKDAERYYDLADEYVQLVVAEGKVRLKGGIVDDVSVSAICSDAGDPTLIKVPVSRDVFYHHRRPEDASIGHADEEKGGVFYQYEAMQADQLFSGCISGPGKLVGILYDLLASDSELRVGKSRTVQYGMLKLESVTAGRADVRWKPEVSKAIDAGSLLRNPDDDVTLLWGKGKSLCVTALSDVILRNGEGLLQPSPQCLARTVARSLASDHGEMPALGVPASFVHTVLVGGFSGVWRLPRQQCLALERGSVVVLFNDSGEDLDLRMLAGRNYGERTAEGFGRLLFSTSSWGQPRVELRSPGGEANNEFAADLSPLVLGMVRWAHLRNLRMLLADDAAKRVRNCEKQVPSSFLSRLEAIVQVATDCENLVALVEQLKEPSKANLRRLDGVLPSLAKPTGDISTPEIVDSFRTTMNKLCPSSPTEPWSQAVAAADPHADEETFALYQFYVSSLLRAVRVKQRSKADKPKPKGVPAQQVGGRHD